MTQVCVKGDIRVPVGHILVCDKWRNGLLVTALQAQVRVLFEEDLGVVDFHPSASVGVVYLTEADLVAGALFYKRKLARLRKANKCRGIVLAEKTALSSQYYQALQKFVMMELGFLLYPISNEAEAAGLLAQLVNVENKPESNTFLKPKKPVLMEKAVLSSLQCLPKLGEVKANALLQKFHSIERICAASVEELSEVLGKSGAIQVKNFFNG